LRRRISTCLSEMEDSKADSPKTLCNGRCGKVFVNLPLVLCLVVAPLPHHLLVVCGSIVVVVVGWCSIQLNPAATLLVVLVTESRVVTFVSLVS
jgi:hypothetical protein